MLVTTAHLIFVLRKGEKRYQFTLRLELIRLVVLCEVSFFWDSYVYGFSVPLNSIIHKFFKCQNLS